jgi:copper resistance protein C
MVAARPTMPAQRSAATATGANPNYGGGVRRARAGVVIGLTLLWTLAVVPGSAAWAHTTLVSSTPTDGAQVDSSPATIELVFSEPVNPELVTVVVSDAAGTEWQAGAPIVTGAVVSQPLQPLTQAGAYVLAYRVVSADGHPVAGQVGFTLASLPAPTPIPTAAPSRSTLSTATPVAAQAPPSSDDSASSAVWTYAAIGLPVVALLFAGGMAVARAGSRGGRRGHGG